ncbi:GNAT family N-acetyltransferase [Arthrobacter sp. H5]|uniref:GNAT family N-acetyltransferase n=1 Tax=Arthrobacter sp. H5 TaxID=1267973 RepID=UPI0020A695A8|nr:GNAT family N-acetyltransferase [Arthrobacter sp. H5]
MTKLRALVAPWLPSARTEDLTGDDSRHGDPGKAIPNAGDVPHTGNGHNSVLEPGLQEPEFRTLGRKDTGALWDLVSADSVANVFMASHLEVTGTAAPSPSGGEVIGSFRDGALISACWAGVNLVPIGIAGGDGAALGSLLGRSGRKFSSIFGPADGVMSIWSTLQPYSAKPFDVRPEQPLLKIQSTPNVEPAAGLRFTRPHELDLILPACAAMFEEEVGYSPYVGGEQHYRRRVATLVRKKHSLVDFDDKGQVIFKAELGTVSADAVQIQGVWMNPVYRGRGLSAGYMAAVVIAALDLAPVASLYVNSFNTRAMSAYGTVGFTESGNFATVLF